MNHTEAASKATGERVIPDFYLGELRRILYRYETWVSESDTVFVGNRDIGISHCQIGGSDEFAGNLE